MGVGFVGTLVRYVVTESITIVFGIRAVEFKIIFSWRSPKFVSERVVGSNGPGLVDPPQV